MWKGLIAGAAALCLAGAPVSGSADPQGPALAVILAERPAATLSAYRLFRDARAGAPNTGVIPYDLATPLFSDYALKSRYLFTPPGQSIAYAADDVFTFQIGAVLVKTFAYPADFRRPESNVHKIETRLLIRHADGWTAQTYVWDADGNEARLQIAGERIPVHFTDATGAARDVQYAVPNKNQCKGCHAVGDTLTPIGLRARNLNRTLTYGDRAGNQIAHWSRIGLLTGAPAQADIPRLPLFSDLADGSLDARARAYLDVNCAHCHNPQGPASNSGLDLRFAQSDPAHWGLRKRPVAAGRATADLMFAIDPGHPERSILVHRMESDDPGVMMPELGRTVVHTEGVDLVRRWIAAMDTDGHTTAQH